MFALPLLLSSQAAALVTGGSRAPAGLTRRQALGAAAVLPFAPAACQAFDKPPAATKSGVGITVMKTGTGGTPTKGDLCAIRFKGSVKATGQVFDDIMASAEPYYFRVGKCAWALHACVCVCVCVCARGGRGRLRAPNRAGCMDCHRPWDCASWHTGCRAGRVSAHVAHLARPSRAVRRCCRAWRRRSR